MPGPFNPEETIAALQTGKTDVVDAIYAAYRERFFRWAGRRFQATRQDFEDAWQEAVMALFEQVVSGKLTSFRTSPRVWLFAVGYRQLLKRNRKTKRILWRDAIDDALLKDVQLFDFQWDEPPVDEWALVGKAMQAISPQCREMLSMRFYQGVKIPDMRAALGHNSENTTSAALSRCLKKLKEIVTGTVGAEPTHTDGK